MVSVHIVDIYLMYSINNWTIPTSNIDLLVLYVTYVAYIGAGRLASCVHFMWYLPLVSAGINGGAS